MTLLFSIDELNTYKHRGSLANQIFQKVDKVYEMQ